MLVFWCVVDGFCLLVFQNQVEIEFVYVVGRNLCCVYIDVIYKLGVFDVCVWVFRLYLVEQC